MTELKEKQRQVLQYIIDFISKNGVSPSIREICSGLGVSSTSTIHARLEALEKAGYIQKNENISRSITVKGWEGRSKEIPVLKMLKDGVEITEGYIMYTSPSLSKKELFALKITDDKLSKYNIVSNDYIIAEKTKEYENDCLMVINDSGLPCVIKTSDDNVHVNEKPTDKENIIGKVVALQREYN